MKEKKYFCDCCGNRFITNLKDFDAYCTKCGSYCVFEETKENCIKSIEKLED